MRFTDAFDRVSATTLGAQYAERSSSTTSPPFRTNGEVGVANSDKSNYALLTDTAVAPVGASRYVALTIDGTAHTLGIVINSQLPASGLPVTGYSFTRSQTALRLARLGTAFIDTPADIPATPAADDRLAMVRDQTTGEIICWFNGAEVFRVVDNMYAGGYVGLRSFGTVNATFDNFQVGDYTTTDASGVLGLPSPSTAPPGQVVGVAATGITDSGFLLSWTAEPTAASYDVTVTPAGGAASTQTVTGTSATVTGRTASTAHTVVVTARNAQGAGTPSSSITVTTAAPPSNPPGQATPITPGTATSTTLPLTWGAVTSATSYTVEYRATGATAWTAIPATTALSVTLTGLTPSTAYEVRHRASNTFGPGAYSTTATASTIAEAANTVNEPNADGLPRWRGLIYTRAGEQIIAGGSELHKLSADFFGASGPVALPSWLTVAEGNAALSGTLGRVLKLTSAGSVGARAALEVAVPINTAEVGAVKIELRHMAFSAANVAADWRLYFTDGAAVGASAIHLNGKSTVDLASRGEASTTGTPQAVLGEHSARRRHTCLLVSTATREVWLLQEDSVIGYRDCSAAWTDGVARIGVSVTAQTSTAVELRLASMDVTLYSRDI